MQVEWVGHAAFLITAKDGTTILTDPYQPGGYDGAVGYAPIKDTVDIVTVSHEHADHNYPQGLPGTPAVVRHTATVKGIKFDGVQAYHDEEQGTARGQDTIFKFTVDNVTIAHCGDLGHTLNAGQVAELQGTDVLLLPVGGTYTVDARQAGEVVKQVRPKVVIPMHFKTPQAHFPLAEVEDFIRGKSNVKRINGTSVKIETTDFPAFTEIWVLKPSH